jgi:CRISPR-associated protein Cst2
MNTPKLNLFASVLTYPAPSSNYRGESEENRTVIQRIHKNGAEYAVISPESMRNALREILAKKGLPSNRSRLHSEDQLAVEFKDFPDASKYADDFLFGYMVADPKVAKQMKGRPAKRDSVLRMNMAVALTAYQHDATFHQSPQNAGSSPWKNSANSALLHREVATTAFQYPFALSLADCSKDKATDAPKWAQGLLLAIAELSNVAGGHARSYYEMAPRSIVLRLTPSLVAGLNTYGFDDAGRFPELARLHKEDLPGSEFWIGGAIVRDMGPDERERLKREGAHLYENPQRLLADVGEAVLAAAG